nr:pentatricopeptide repeat-containing protein, chloroplastic [Quercus suber]POE81807.1 pentatricopeptide repeat-containing protein, chloroplastic [Quercus suber]
MGLQDDMYLNNNLLSLYAKCFGVDHAHHFFDEMPCKDVVSWTGILSSYVRNENHEQALRLFDSMLNSSQYPNEFTLSSVLRSCSALGEFDYGTLIQAYMIKNGFDSNPILASVLIDLYSKCNCTEEAYKVFECMDGGDTVSWTTMISSLVQAQKWSQALQFYIQMIEKKVPPNEFTFVKLLAASGSLGSSYGKLVHAHMILLGIELNVILKTSLVDMYSKCHRMEDAVKVSNQTPERDVFLWTAIISGFIQNMKVKEAIAALSEMVMSGIVPNNFSYSTILNASSSILSLELGEQVHSRVIKAGLEDDISVGNALIDMYMKCSNLIDNALRVFRGMSSPNVITWTSLIAGFAKHGFEEDSFRSFEEMRALGLAPNSFTLSSILGACSTMKSHSQTMKLHGYIIKIKADCDIVVGNALVDAYAGLGMVDEARCVVRKMDHRDAITYTSLATRINQMGYHDRALEIIKYMNKDDVKMDGFSMSSFLSAAAGLGSMKAGMQLHCFSVKSGLRCWLSVSNGLVDLYGKCGCIHDAHRAFGEITEPDVASWNGWISGLASNGYISSALSAFEDMRSGRSDLSEKARGLMKERGLMKNPCQSWMEIRNQIHHFTAEDRSHPQINQIHEKIESLMTEFKYRGYLYRDNRDKSYHSEKLAVAFGLLSTPSKAPILIIKNTRICMDCHYFVMLVTELVDREIILREGNRVHSFRKGNCSCRGYQ